MPSFNIRLLERCLALGDKDHYRKGGRETDLFAEDRKALLALPEARFDVVTWKRMKADKYGIVTVEGRHRYAAGPEHAGRELIVGLRAFEVELLDASGARITTHPRAYGDNPTSSKRPVHADRAAVATGPGPGPTARSGRRFPTRCANGSTGRSARSSPRGCARSGRPNARADGRTRWRRWPRSSRPPEASTAPAYAWPRPDTPPGPSPSPTTSPSTRRGYDLAFAGREDNA